VVIVTPSAIAAQEIIEVDFAVGRIIMDDELRAMSNVVLAIDRERAVLYTEDREEPEAVMAFSLETGEWLRTIRTPTGGGPNEFPQGKTGIAMAPHGGLHVAGVLRVITFDSLGVPLSHWQPRVPTSRKVCDFAGVPAVPTQGGVVRRGPDGEDQSIGPNVVEGQVIATTVRAEALAISDRIWKSRIACSGDAAYVVWSYEGAPDSVSVYHLDGRESNLDVPAEYADERAGCRRQTRNPAGRVIRDAPCPTWNQRLDLSLDDRGNVVLLGRDVATPGAIVDPRNGCYAVIRARTRTRASEPRGSTGIVYSCSAARMNRRTGMDGSLPCSTERPTGYRFTHCDGSTASRARGCCRPSHSTSGNSRHASVRTRR